MAIELNTLDINWFSEYTFSSLPPRSWSARLNAALKLVQHTAQIKKLIRIQTKIIHPIFSHLSHMTEPMLHQCSNRLWSCNV